MDSTPWCVKYINANIERSYKDFAGQAVEEPLGTITASPKGGKHALIAPTMIQTGYGEAPGQAPRALDVGEPLGTVVGGGQKHAVVAAWLAKHYDGPRGGTIGHELTRPIGTVTAKDHHSLAAATIISMNHGDKQWHAVDEPLRTITSGGNKAGLVYAFLVKYFSSGGQWAAADEPLATITAKHRMGLVGVTVMVEGVEYLIVDIGLRMLSPRELARCQGFPDDYQLPGRSKAGHVRLIGNSVPPVLPEALTRANCPGLCRPEKRTRSAQRREGVAA